MQIEKYTFSFQELGINTGYIQYVLGNDQGQSNAFQDIIGEVVNAAPQYCDIQGGYSIEQEPVWDAENRKLWVGEIEFDLKKIVFNQIRKAESVAFFLCTAGEGIGAWSKELMAKGDLLEGYIVDVVGSTAVEAAMDKIQGNLQQEMQNAGLKITNRYSPGYCDWLVSEQHKLFKFLPENFCGITLTESALMVPIKSVSGIIGIGKEVKFNDYVCNICDMEECIYRNKKIKSVA